MSKGTIDVRLTANCDQFVAATQDVVSALSIFDAELSRADLHRFANNNNDTELYDGLDTTLE